MRELSRYGHCTLDQDGCTTCGDIGIPVEVVRLFDGGRALCRDRAGQQAEIATEFTPGVHVGDVLLVHMGVAIAHIEDSHERHEIH